MQHDLVQRMHHHRDQSPQLGGAVQRDGTDPVEIRSGAPETQSRSRHLTATLARAPATSRGVGRGLLVNTHVHKPNLMMPSSSNRMLPRQIYRFILCDDYLPTSYMIHNYPTQERITRILGVILCLNITRISSYDNKPYENSMNHNTHTLPPPTRVSYPWPLLVPKDGG